MWRQWCCISSQPQRWMNLCFIRLKEFSVSFEIESHLSLKWDLSMLCCTLSTVSWDSTLDRYVRSLRAEVWRNISMVHVKNIWSDLFPQHIYYVLDGKAYFGWMGCVFVQEVRVLGDVVVCVCWRVCVGGVRHGTHCVIECKEHGCVKQVVFVSRLESVLMWCPWIPCYKLYKNNEEEEKREKENVKKVMCLCFMYMWRVEGRMNDSCFLQFLSVHNNNNTVLLIKWAENA